MTLTDNIDTIVQGAISRRIFPGAVVLVARGGTIRHFAAYGSTMYDAPGSRPVARDTIYDIASLTKVFTATAALCLADQGRLDLYAPAAAYLPELQAPGITVFQLLTHTSGLDVRLSTLRESGRDGVLAAAYTAALRCPPGTTVAYTNVNSLLLGEIVARLQGTSLDIALRTLAAEPLGLRDTQFCPPAELLPRIAPTEIDESWRGGLVHGSVHDESAHALGGVAGHAGLFSTAADLYRFCEMWLGPEQRTKNKEQKNQRTTEPPNRRTENHPEGTRPRTENREPRPETPELKTQNSKLKTISSPSPLHPFTPSLLRPETIALATINHTHALNMGCGLGWMMDRPGFMGSAPGGTFGHTGFTGPALVVVPQERLIVVVLSNRVYPRRRPPEHHTTTRAVVDAALHNV